MNALLQSGGGAALVVFSAVLFRIYSSLIQQFCPSPTCVSERGKNPRWFNIVVSLTHSTISTLGCLYCFYIDPDLASKILESYTTPAYVVTCFSLGYFIHDLLHAVMNRKISDAWEIILHHVVVIFCFGIAAVLHKYVNYVIVSLLCEMNSVFLHIRQLCNMAGLSTTTFSYRLNSMINIVTYILFRICALTWMVRWLVLHKEVMPSLFHTIGVTGMSVMTVINVVLFARLLVKDYWHRVGSSNMDSFKTK